MPIFTAESRGEITLVTIDNPPVNAISQQFRAELLDLIKTIDENENCQQVVLCCAGRTFVAGADIAEFNQAPSPPHLPDVINRLEQSKKTWIAALHGTVLGGGLELALACHYRIALSGTKLGLPEVNLGLIPGAGGTIRLPRVIPVKDAIKLITGGKPINDREALQLGLITEIVSADLVEKTLAYALELAAKSRPGASSSLPIAAMPDAQDWQVYRADVERRTQGQIAPLVALDTIQKNLTLNLHQAQVLERANFLALKEGEQSRALRSIFSAEKSCANPKYLKQVDPIDVNEVGIVGGGTMGSGIAAAFLLAGFNVKLVERETDGLEKGLHTITKLVTNSRERGLIDDEALTRAKSKLSGSIEFASLSEVDLVIEAVFEDMDVKLQVFSALEKSCKPSAILATNTSYLDVNAIAASIKDPSRVIGLHFFSPAHIMKLLEIIRTDFVADRILATAIRLAKQLKKVAVIAGVCDGFIGNRIMSAYRRECEFMLEDGALPQEIDNSMTDFGFPMGIFAMQDLAGLDIAWAMRKRQAKTRDPNTRYVAIADRLCELQRFGRKTGAGWYLYPDNAKQGIIDPLVESIIVEESSRKSITRQPISAHTTINRILDTMHREGNAIIAEKIAASTADIDVVMVNGFGFPRWRGGPMYFTNS